MNKMTREEFHKYFQDLQARAFTLMKKKNSDYGASVDPFANFRMAVLVGVENEKGILLRMQDKMARLITFIRRGSLEVAEETWEDACIDIANYAFILAGMFKEAAGEKFETMKVAHPGKVPQEGADKNGLAGEGKELSNFDKLRRLSHRGSGGGSRIGGIPGDQRLRR